jgi:molecular chaperone DnaK
MVKEGERNVEADRERKALIEARNLADNLVYQAEKTLRELGDKAEPGLKAEVEAKVSEVKKALEGDDKGQIVAASEALQQTLSQLGQAAYQQAQSQPQTQGQPAGNGADDRADTSGDDENVVEGEFTEA